MNEFTLKKLGEVLAFAMVGRETFAQGEKAFGEVLAEETVAKAKHEHARAIQDIGLFISDKERWRETVTKKAEATGKKLRGMRDLYIGGQWDDGTELLEWSSFFEGAAAVHWHVVRGALKKENDPALDQMASSAIAFHENFLKTISEKIESIAEKKSLA